MDILEFLGRLFRNEINLREMNSNQFEKGISFVHVNAILEQFAENKNLILEQNNIEYQKFLCDLNSVLKKWSLNWRYYNLDIDISINSIKRINK